MLNPGEVTVGITILKSGIDKSKIGEIAVDGPALKSCKLVRDGGEVIDSPGRESKQGKNQIVVPQILPQVVEGAVIERPVCPSEKRAACAEQIVGRAQANSE